ncbi:hypothetical protein BX600DRAFT_555681 [Xylariales sp. PMI_506]|nr:hypothetical protein BX600DRAFT_555681 [Xylariales sp. PMI_506]
MSNPVQFVLVGPKGQIDGRTRSWIRSQVMLGKNKNQKPKLRDRKAALVTASRRMLAPLPIRSQAADNGTDSIARAVAPPLSSFRYAEEMEPYMLDLVYKYFNGIKKELYPCGWCLKQTDTVPKVWFDYLMLDPLYLNCVLFSCSYVYDTLFHDAVSGRYLSSISESGDIKQLHFGKTLKLLQERVNGDVHAMSGTTLATVVIILWMAAICGDVAAAEAHMRGIEKIIDLLGDVPPIGIPLNFIICLADICVAFLGVQAPILPPKYFYWKYPCLESNMTTGLDLHEPPCYIAAFVILVNEDLATILNDLQTLVRTGKLMHQRAEIVPDEFKKMMVSSVHRVITFNSTSSIGVGEAPATMVSGYFYGWQEALRFGLLSFSANAFLQLEAAKVEYRRIKRCLQQAILHIEAIDTIPLTGELRRKMLIATFWLTMLVLATFDFEDKYDDKIKEITSRVVNELGLNSWSEAKELLNGVLWLDTVFSGRGEDVFKCLAL